MRLRTKLVLILGVTFVGLLAAVYLTASKALLRGFARLEDENVQHAMRRVVAAVDGELARLDAVALRWSHDEAGGGGETAGAAPVENPRPSADFVVVADSSGRPRVAALAAGSVAPDALVRDLVPHVAAGAPLVRHAYSESRKSGVLLLPSGAVLVASRPRQLPASPGSGLGAVVAGRFLDGAAIAEIGAAAQASLSVRRWDDHGLAEDFAQARSALAAQPRTLVRPLAEGWVAGYRVLSDLAGAPALIVRLDAPRNIFAQGRASLDYLMVSLLLVVLVFTIVPFVVLDRVVLRRLAVLAEGVAGVGASRSFTARVDVAGSDELAGLAAGINEMLASLERAQGGRGESEARYRAVFEQSGDGIVLFEADSGRVLEANGAFCRLFGVRPDEVLDRSIFDLASESREVVTRHVADVKRDRRVHASEAALRQKDGSAITVEVASSLVSLRGREVVCSAIRDTSERRLLEQRMVQSQKLEAVGRLAAGVAHDFNNLLQSVASAVAQLRARGERDEVRAGATHGLETQVASGAALTRQLLLIARQESFAAAPVELNALVRSISDFLRRVVRANVHFDVELGDHPLPTRGDRARLEQSLINMVANASDAMPAGGRVTIRTGGDADGVWFEVSDDGPGIASDVRARLFEPFFTTKAREQHAGLGLTVVRGIVDEHEGRIDVASEPGRGSVFRVTLPARAAEEPQPAAETTLPIGERAGAGRRVLLVEDGEETRRGLEEMLALLGYEVTAAASGEEALEQAKLLPVHVLLTDFMLPGMNGRDLAHALLAVRPELGVILMSGYAPEDAVLAGVPGDRVRFLSKPFGMDALAREVRAALADVSSPS